MGGGGIGQFFQVYKTLKKKKNNLGAYFAKSQCMRLSESSERKKSEPWSAMLLANSVPGERRKDS